VLQFTATTRLDRTTYPLILLLTVLSSLAAATLSYYLVERPVLRLKDRVPRVLASRSAKA
jgi:peptidoglycan/LPS O-acetylase OafA/YrhL